MHPLLHATVLLLVTTRLCCASVSNFADLVRCVALRNPADYLGYGCYCGKGGRNESMDEIDRCCKLHDNCYDDAMKTNCTNYLVQSPKYKPYTTIYKFTCSEDIDIRTMAQRREGKLYEGGAACNDEVNRECAYTICKCDLEAVECFARHDSTYDRVKARCPEDKTKIETIVDRTAKWYQHITSFFDHNQSWTFPILVAIVVTLMCATLWLLWTYAFGYEARRKT